VPHERRTGRRDVGANAKSFDGVSVFVVTMFGSSSLASTR
jgi:hypothetical protein